MILKYGSYSHDDNECSVTIQKTPTFNDIGVKMGYVERWDVRGVKQAATAALVTTALTSLELAYSTNNLNLILYDSDGSTIRHAMYSSNSKRGVRITGFGYPQGDGAEYSTFRTFSYSAEAEYETDLNIYSYVESYEFSGGGPQFVLIPTLIGQPVYQQIRQATPYRCIQSGTAVGTGSRPAITSPAFPALEHIDGRILKYDSPREFGPNGNRMYAVSWTYVFESASPFFAFPPG